jgi:hypothetical protein
MKFHWMCSVTMLSIIYILLTYLRIIIPRKLSSLYRNKVTVEARQKNLTQTCSKCIVSQKMYLHKSCKWTRSVVRVPGYGVIIVSDQYRLSLPASIPTSVWANHSLTMHFFYSTSTSKIYSVCRSNMGDDFYSMHLCKQFVSI